MTLENRISKLETQLTPESQDEIKYFGDCVIVTDGTTTQEEIEKIMDERNKRSGATNFVVIPTVKPLDK